MSYEQEAGRAERCKHPDKSHKLCVGGCVGSCKRVMEPIPSRCPKHDIDGVGPCYCQPPLLKITFNMKAGGRIVTNAFCDVDSAIVGLNIPRELIRTTNSVRLGVIDAIRYKAGATSIYVDPGCNAVKAQAVRDLIDEMITVHGISGKMLADMQQYADQLERGEL